MHVVPILLMVAMAIPGAGATHLSQYLFNPVEHDDSGRSMEPDFFATSVFGPALADQTIDINVDGLTELDSALPGTPPGHSQVVAPGCTDSAGRQPSGMCGLWTVGAGDTGIIVPEVGPVPGVPPGVQGTSGMDGNSAPGRFSLSKTHQVGFLDARVDLEFYSPLGPAVYVDYNSKLRDTGVRDALGGIESNLGGGGGTGYILPGPAGLWAWYGIWQDKNGNGVVDLFSGPAPSLASPDNEFRFQGKCTQVNGQEAPPGQAYCIGAPDLQMGVAWYPGNHHGYCVNALVGPECPATSLADYPGRQAVCFSLILAGNPLGSFGNCAASVQGLDANDAAVGGDPLLGKQDEVTYDGFMSDATGDPHLTWRGWQYQDGWPAYTYDQSLLVGTVIVTEVVGSVPARPGAAEAPTVQHPGASRPSPSPFTTGSVFARDVDSYRTTSPAAEELLVRAVKPAARSPWVLARDESGTLQRTGDGVEHGRALYDGCDTSRSSECPTAPVAQIIGQLKYSVLEPGHAHEPNEAGDIEPGAVFRAFPPSAGPPNRGDQAFMGWLNDYRHYAASPRAWVDVVDQPGLFTTLAWGPPGGYCIVCVVGPPTSLPAVPLKVREAGEHDRSLPPGAYIFHGAVGAWKDKSWPHDEVVYDVPATVTDPLGVLNALGPATRQYVYTSGPDGWVGDVVETTGTFVYRGYGPETCTIAGESRSRPWAECHPYRDGNGPQPQDYTVSGASEFFGASNGVDNTNAAWKVVLRPASGRWDFPVFVWRAFDTWQVGDQAAIEDRTGTEGPIELPLGLGPGLLTRDLLILSQGNMGLEVRATTEGWVNLNLPGGGTLREFVRDVDTFSGWSVA